MKHLFFCLYKAEAEGGGIIVIPEGVYLSGALFFKPGVKLRLEEGAKLKLTI